MKRKWWVVLAGAMGGMLIIAVCAARTNIGQGGEPLDICGSWEFTARSVLTTVDGERERERVGGLRTIGQDGTHLFLYFDPPGVEYNGALGGLYMAAASCSDYLGGEAKQDVFHSILDARVNRKCTRIVGKIKAIQRDYGYYGYFGDEGSFETIRFTAKRVDDLVCGDEPCEACHPD